MPAKSFLRYAIYYTPPPGPLERFGAEWLGWDIAAGCAPARRPDVPDLPLPMDVLTQGPRRYGFHATIKPPFRLAPDRTEAELTVALAAFCADRAPVYAAELELAPLGRFVALVPKGDATAFSGLASEVVRAFDDFRAPPTEAEIARHSSPALDATQIKLLYRWGYPHVINRFRWHMTLTGKHSRAEVAGTHAALATALTPLLPRPYIMDALSLVGEDTMGHFHLIQRTQLTG